MMPQILIGNAYCVEFFSLGASVVNSPTSNAKLLPRVVIRAQTLKMKHQLQESTCCQRFITNYTPLCHCLLSSILPIPFLTPLSPYQLRFSLSPTHRSSRYVASPTGILPMPEQSRTVSHPPAVSLHPSLGDLASRCDPSPRQITASQRRRSSRKRLGPN